jgi:hypothetical protein
MGKENEKKAVCGKCRALMQALGDFSCALDHKVVKSGKEAVPAEGVCPDKTERRRKQ